jgi:O-antigen ligase
MIRQGLVATVVVAAAIIASGSLLVQPWLVLAGTAGILLLLFSVRIMRHPRSTAVVAFLLVFLAETKFRQRDADAMLSGSVDSQVIFELAMYAALGWIVFLAITVPPKPARRISPSIALGLGGYGALALLSTAWSAAPAITLVRSIQLCILVAVAICLSLRADPATIFESLLIALVLYCGVFSILALVVPGGAPRLDIPGKTERFSWFAVHPGAVAMYCAVTVLLLIAALLNGLPRMPRSRRLTLGFTAIAVFGAVLLATRSRTDLIALALTVGALLIRRMRLRPSVLVAGMLGGVAIIGFAVTIFGASTLFNGVLSDNGAVGDYLLRGQTTDQFMSLDSRTTLWKEMTPLIVARPVLGWGFEASRRILLDVFFWASYAHNALVQTVLGLGVFGIALLMPLFGSCFFVGERSQPTLDGPAFARTAAIGIAVYFGTESIASESFAGTPGFAVLVVFLCMLAAADLRRQARESARATPLHQRAAPLYWGRTSPVLEGPPA